MITPEERKAERERAEVLVSSAWEIMLRAIQIKEYILFVGEHTLPEAVLHALKEKGAMLEIESGNLQHEAQMIRIKIKEEKMAELRESDPEAWELLRLAEIQHVAREGEIKC